MNIQTLFNHFSQTTEGTWIMQFPNAVDLYNFIKNHPIKKVLSLGTGVGFSDSVIALAWKDKGVENGEIDSIEQFDKCIKIANELIPEELKKYIKIQKQEPKIWTTDKIAYQYFSVYKELPDKDYDLIINDGPGPFVDEYGSFVEIPNGTIHKLTLEDKIKPGTFIIYDGRIPSLNLLERYFDSCYYLVNVPKNGSDFFVLERKNTPGIIKDVRYEAFLENTTYFKNEEESKQKNSISSNKQGSSSKTEVTDKGATEKV